MRAAAVLAADLDLGRTETLYASGRGRRHSLGASRGPRPYQLQSRYAQRAADWSGGSGCPELTARAKVAELVDALGLGPSGETRESSSLSFRTNFPYFIKYLSVSAAGPG